MTPVASRIERDRVGTLLAVAVRRPSSPFEEAPGRAVVIDVAHQQAFLVRPGEPVTRYPVSTAVAGIGGQAESNRTPPGWHRIHGRIGDGCPSGTVFESREPTGESWRGERRDEDLILTRILTLEGLEEGVNKGPGCDSLDRFIYIHGTNHERSLGRPASHGCIRMANTEVIELFDAVREGDPVVIVDTEVDSLA